MDSPATDSTSCDDWDARTVTLHDSVSVIATGKDRSRIDRWKRLCKGQEEGSAEDL